MSEKVFKILSIDGGGIKGLYSSSIIEQFEEKFGITISDYFDLICGTSTGGLIALALSLKISAKEISEYYIKNGPKIFPNHGFIKSKVRQLIYPGKFNDKSLKKSLKNIFEEKTIGESNNLLCIPSYSVTKGKPRVFKFDHKEGEMRTDNHLSYIDVALATSAAPSFFPLAEINLLDNEQFIDGGIWANNPALTGLIEALKFFVGEHKRFSQLQILSISSLNLVAGKPTGLGRYRGLYHWRNDLFEYTLNAQSYFINHFMESLCKINQTPLEYLRIPSADLSREQIPLIKLDRADKKALDIIRIKGKSMGIEFSRKEELKRFFTYKKNYIIKN